MFKEQPREFLYKGHAVGVSATFTKPYAEHLEAQASCALSIHGGMSAGRAEHFNHRNIISFRAAHSQAIGTKDQTNRSWNSLITCTVEGLNVHNVVTCDRIVARLASHHYADGREASIITLGSHFENLKVAGQLVQYDPHGQLLGEWDTMTKARDNAKPHAASSDSRRLHYSVVRDVSCKGGVQVSGHVIKFPEFGIIHLGEIIVSEGERRLVMMRIEFGCEVDGDGNLNDVGGNGVLFP